MKNVLLHDDLGSALGEKPISTTFPWNNSRHALSNAIESIDPREGFLRVVISNGLIFFAQGHYESK